jgi:tRNA pseudouridine55 synthase
MVQNALPLTSPNIQRLLAEHKILLIDKPLGRSSHYMVKQIRTETGIQRVGHAGTLDPQATGLLVILVGRDATRIQDSLMGLDKEYEFTAQLGIETTTYDSVGEITQQCAWEELKHITVADVQDVLGRFTGQYLQQVPAYSAVKQHGRKLYEMALRHQPIDLPSRLVTIHALTLESFRADESLQRVEFSCHVHCGSGTYVRSLAVDIGRALGVGAAVTSLRRTRVGPFHVQNARSSF